MDRSGGAHRVAAIVIGVVLVIAWLSTLTPADSASVFPSEAVAEARQLVRSSIDAVTSASQDNDRIMALVHATEARTLLGVARKLIPDAALSDACNTSIPELGEHMDQQVETASRNLANVCKMTK